MADAPAAGDGSARSDTFFERSLPRLFTFGAFGGLALPLIALRCVPNDVALLPYLMLFEVVGLGTTHFFITLAVYADAANLRHFTSTWTRRVAYFALPLGILIGIAAIEALALRTSYPRAAHYFYAGVRLWDFFHVGRQSAGVLQLWKRPLGARLPAWTRRAENGFFVGAALLQWQTFWNHGSFGGDVYAVVPALLLAATGVAICVPYLAALRAAGAHKQLLCALAYFLMQAACAAAAIYATWLYLTALALHYVEYHALMAPRCLRRQAAASKPLWPRGASLYGLLAVSVVAFEARQDVVTDSIPLAFVVHAFDGIFLLHYVLDAFLWKFRDPYYAARLAPLYFTPAQREPSRPSRPRTLAVAAACTLALASGLVVSDLRALHARWIAPLHAQEHLRWGLRLVQAGDLRAGHHHIERACELAPQDERVRNLLRLIEQHVRAPQTPLQHAQAP